MQILKHAKEYPYDNVCLCVYNVKCTCKNETKYKFIYLCDAYV